MASLVVQGEELIVQLSRIERLAAMHGDVRVILGAVQDISVEPDPWCELRGIRSPGTGFPGVIAYGVRRLTGDRPDFAAVWGRRPAIRVQLAPGAPFARLLVTVAEPAMTVQALRRQLGAAPGA